MIPSLLRFRFGEQVLECGARPLVMGILNVTPDSFSDGGEHNTLDAALARGVAMVQEGVDLIDVGGESTRPGSRPVSAEEEIERVEPVIRRLANLVSVPISIDTMKAATAHAALDAGAVLVNDVSALQHDPEMASVLSTWQAGCILMHMRGTPTTMQGMTQYDNVVAEVRQELSHRLAWAVEATGLDEEFFMLDPGIGFGKTPEQNLALIGGIEHFRSLGRPVLMGPSRKSFLGHILERPDPTDRLWGTAAAVTACVLAGADVVRVHDVRAMRDAACVAAALRAFV